MNDQLNRFAPALAGWPRARSADQTVYVQLALATFFWAGVFVFGKQSLIVLDPLFLAWTRFTVAAFVIVAWFTLLSRWRRRSFATYVRFAWLGLLGVFGYNVLFLQALKMSTPLHGLVIIATTPAWTTMLSTLLLRTRVRRGELIGIATAFAAVLLGVLGTPDNHGHSGNSSLEGDSFFVAAAVVWAVYSIEIRRTVAVISVLPDEITGWGLVFGAVMLLPPAAIGADIPLEFSRMRLFDAATILYIGVCGTVLAFLFWSRGLQTIGPVRTSIFLNFVPIWGTILSAILLHDWPSGTTFGAMLLAIAGVVTMQRSAS